MPAVARAPRRARRSGLGRSPLTAAALSLALVLGAVGCVLGGAGYLFRRLVPGMVAHAILNGVAMAVVLSGWTLGG